MVPVVVPASGEYAALVGCWKAVGAGGACWCWHTVGFWDSRHILCGCDVVSWLSLRMVKHRLCVGVGLCGGCCLRTA